MHNMINTIGKQAQQIPAKQNNGRGREAVSYWIACAMVVGLLGHWPMALAGALPVKKACSSGMCHQNSAYVVNQSGVACADCKTPVEAKSRAQARVQKVRTTHPSTPTATASGQVYAQATTSDQTDSEIMDTDPPILESALPEPIVEEVWETELIFGVDYQLDTLNRYYLPMQGYKRQAPSRPMVPTQESEVAKIRGLAESWSQFLYHVSDFERLTEVLFEYWQGDEHTFHKRLQQADLKWPHYLPLPDFNRATLIAMVLQDRLAEVEAFQSLTEEANKKKTLTTLTHFFLNLRQHLEVMESQRMLELLALQRGERVTDFEKLSQNLEEGTSTHFAGAHIVSDTEAYLPRFKALDQQLQELESSLGLESDAAANFRRILGEELHAFQLITMIGISPWFTVEDEPVYENTRGVALDSLGANIEQLGYFSDILNYAKPKPSAESERQQLVKVLPAMVDGQLLALEVGEIRWLVRRAGTGYRLYLPGFWSTEFADSQSLVIGLESLHKSMIAAMEQPLARDITHRVNNRAMLARADMIQDRMEGALQQPTAAERLWQLRHHPLALAPAAIVVGAAASAGGILLIKHMAGK